MARRRAVSALTALGLTETEENRYQQLGPLAGTSPEAVAAALGVSVTELVPLLRRLLDVGVVRLDGGRLEVLPVPQAVAEAIRRESDAAERARERLDDLAAAVPFLAAAASRPAPGEVEDLGGIDGEVSQGGNPLALLTAIIEQSKGDLLFLRPDAWLLPRESAIARVVGRAVASGRRARAIYPSRALREAPEILTARVAEGEEVRVIDHLPTRLMVISGTHAILPEPLGYADEPRLLVRQGALVDALTLLFSLYWERAVPATELAGDVAGERRFLLHQLATGAKDEQIARTLGLSLRTVRRRVAELMIDLGVDTRFQAGAEAVRRGWL